LGIVEESRFQGFGISIVAKVAERSERPRRPTVPEAFWQRLGLSSGIVENISR
jgi:hypothetical protein